jgi:DNA helicase IV
LDAVKRQEKHMNEKEQLERENKALKEQVELLKRQIGFLTKKLDDSRSVRIKLLNDIQKISDRNIAAFEKYNTLVIERKNEALEIRNEIFNLFEENVLLKNKLMKNSSEIERLKDLYHTTLKELYETSRGAIETFINYRNLVNQSTIEGEKIETDLGVGA